MPIKAYVGQMRSGKSYEVVSNVILNGLRDGRRVVSNIAGLNYGAMRELLIAEGCDSEEIGELVAVSHEEVEKPSFWRTDKDEAEGFDSFIRPGDLVALDEIWRFWKKRGEIHPRAMNFVRMHGHMPHPVTGFTCEIALITQSVRDINENVKDVVQETFLMTKLTAIGAEGRYRVDIFQGGGTAKSSFLRSLQRSYNPKYFPLYSSHSQRKEGAADAVEKNIDKRGNILQGALFKIVIPVGALVFVGSFWGVWHFLHPEPKAPAPTVQSGQSAQAKPVKSGPTVSDDWRVTGYYSTADNIGFLLHNGSRLRVLQNPPNFKITAVSAETFLPTGEAVTGWSGNAGKSGPVDRVLSK